MFESEVARPLFDIVNGGSPRAYECLLDTEEWGVGGKMQGDACGSVTRTWRGMKTHLWLVHKFVAQGELFKDLEAQDARREADVESESAAQDGTRA